MHEAMSYGLMADDTSRRTIADLRLEDGEDQILDVLDLPQLYTKPSASTLLATLDDLRSEPSSWDTTPRTGTPRTPLSGTSTPLQTRKRRKIIVKSESVALAQYLTRIISSPLTWIDDDEEKERMWETAAKRLSERSGRAGMGGFSRTFVIPLHPPMTTSGRNNTGVGIVEERLAVSGMDSEEVEEDEVVEITLHEPALTADNLGLKTWASSHLLAKRLCRLRDSNSLPCLLDPDARVLELGSGTGLVGLAAAAVLQAKVLLTDLPAIVPNLERNIRENAAMVSRRGGRAEVGVLDWEDPGGLEFTCPSSSSSSSLFDSDLNSDLNSDSDLDGQRQQQQRQPQREEQQCQRRYPSHSFSLILAADPIYSPDHPRLLVQTIAYHLSRDHEHARVVVEMPLREGYAGEREDFRERMVGLGLRVLEEGVERGVDDWGGASSGDGFGGEVEDEEGPGVDGEGEGWEGEGEGVVRCWWSVWGWG
ncbi:hypothetical protein BAUCODRAFT_380761 [Baudoinia panamericana UAMH 10762]|uniref:Uncharacterized protein n=1 Tax=Baudoinia panamericana (strain UAMH 10762) TaxID=717646 RepID=M2NHH9_BAUPA|nr:uncharacterized protein BAUCODRAFT_380761 [Baudoinia panamericana UAMH 10762]EMC98804.1 hypothetical protein BAUCODRAFT_380761 [Baudoinia panamericana UAMH 10762]